MIVGVGTDLVDDRAPRAGAGAHADAARAAVHAGRGDACRWSRSRPGSPPRRRWSKALGAPGRTVLAGRRGRGRGVGPAVASRCSGTVADAVAAAGRGPRAPVAVPRRRLRARVRRARVPTASAAQRELSERATVAERMRRAHTVEQVRAAEKELMARLPEGALMQRAATGLAVAIADLLGSVYAARVLLLVGAGDNGGDALWAGAMLARRGAAVEAVLLSSKVHVDGLAALRAAGGRTVSVGRRPPARRRRGRDRRHRRPTGSARTRPRTALARFAGSAGRGRGRPVGGGRGHRAPRGRPRARRPDRHLRHPQDRPPRRPGGAGLRGGAPRRHRARPAGGAGRGPAAGRRRGAAAGAGGRSRTSTPAVSSGSAPARRPIPGLRCCAPPAR